MRRGWRAPLCQPHGFPYYFFLDPHSSLLQHHSYFKPPLTQKPHIAPTHSSFRLYTSGPVPIPPCPPSEVECWEQPPQQSHNSCSLPVAFLIFLVYSKTMEIFYSASCPGPSEPHYLPVYPFTPTIVFLSSWMGFASPLVCFNPLWLLTLSLHVCTRDAGLVGSGGTWWEWIWGHISHIYIAVSTWGELREGLCKCRAGYVCMY